MSEGTGGVTHRAVGAGRWFPAERDVLHQMVQQAVDGAEVPSELPGRVVAGIAPHAGYIYSGGVAGHTYSAIRHSAAQSGELPTVVVLGFSHRAAFEGVALLDGAAMVTPLGEVALDEELARELVSVCGSVHFDAGPHAGEHSAENQVPFLQVSLPGAKLVLALMGDHREETVAELATALHAVHGRRPLVVVASTDLLHDADYARVGRTDARTLDLIASLDVHRLGSEWDYAHQICCGIAPVLTALQFARLCGCRAGHALAYRNSGDDFPESRGEWVVGYGSVVFSEVCEQIKE